MSSEFGPVCVRMPNFMVRLSNMKILSPEKYPLYVEVECDDLFDGAELGVVGVRGVRVGPAGNG